MTEFAAANSFWLVLLAMAIYFLFRNSLITALTWLFVLKLMWSKKRRIYDVPFSPNQLKKEFYANIQSLLIDAAVFTAFMQIPWIHFNKNSSVNFFLTFSLLFVFFEAWFYFTHRLMHHPKVYFIHKQHHIAKVTSPFSAMSFSAAERFIHIIGAFIIPALLARYASFICFEGVLAYTFINYVFNILGHSNIELYSPSYPQSPLGKIGTGTAFHSLHHARYNGHYGLFTSVLDRWLKTYFIDYPEVQKRAATGHALSKLGERF